MPAFLCVEFFVQFSGDFRFNHRFEWRHEETQFGLNFNFIVMHIQGAVDACARKCATAIVKVFMGHTVLFFQGRQQVSHYGFGFFLIAFDRILNVNS